MDNKERFFDLLVDMYYDAGRLGDLSEIITNATDPFSSFICELLCIEDSEYTDMLDNAVEIAMSIENAEMLKRLQNVGIVRKD